MTTTEYRPADLARDREDDSEDLFLLDVRREDEYEEWQIPNTTNLPIYDDLLDADFSTLADNLDALPEDQRIVVICVEGVTSADAAAFLRDHGYDAVSLDGGMNGWARLHRAYSDATPEGLIQVVRPGTGCVSYLLHSDGDALVVDPSQYIDEYRTIADDHDLTIVGVADTHAHADHVSGARRLAGDLDVPYYLHEADVGALEDVTPIADGDALTVGDRTVTLTHTPGHTPGSVSLHWGDSLIAGDTLFLASVGRPDLEDGDPDAVRTAARRLFESLDTLTDLDDDTLVFPGHFSDERRRPLVTDLGALRSGTTNELLGYVDADDETAFVETIVDSLAEEPANYNEIKQINWGHSQPDGDVEALELGPNNCAAN
ncbi:MAG: rhodanese-like domain-containing protein [Halobacteriaceae archaeon]